MAYAMEGYQARPKKEYITTAPFHTSIYSYATTGPTATALQTTGKLQLLSVTNTGVTAAVCPAGRILREVGARLYPGVHPGLQSGETNYFAGANHIWTKVYDAVTGFSGYIDANAPIFATYSNERPQEFVDLGEIDGTGRRGPSVFTSGNVTAGGQIRSSTVTALGTGATASIDGTLGQVFTLAQANGQAMTISCGTVPLAGSIVYVVITPAGTAALVTWGTNIKGLNVTPTAAKVTTCSFVSDGTNLNQFGAITST